MSVLVDEGLVTTEKVVPNFPAGKTVFIQTDADLTIAWWDPNTRTYGAAEAIVAPGDEVSVPSHKAKITTATTANFRITIASN